MPKKALRGLKDIGIFPILEDNEKSYKVGERVSIPYAQKITRDEKTSSEDIWADDEIYDDDELFEGEDFELTTTELGLDLYEKMEGGDYDEETQEYSWGPDDEKAYYAMNWRSKFNGGFRMFRYYKCKFKKIKQDLETADNGKKVLVTTISGTFYRRNLIETIKGKAKQKVRVYKDTTTAEGLAWLDTIPTVPAVSTPPEQEGE